MRKAGKKLIPALFAAYILLLCAVFFLREPIGRVRINLVPFDTITTYLTRLSENSINTDIVMRGIFGNILLMLPLGAFAAMYAALREKSGKIFLALSLAFIAATVMAGLSSTRMSVWLRAEDARDSLPQSSSSSLPVVSF